MNISHNLGFGCSSLGGKIDEDKSVKLLNYVYQKKIRYFDLAPSYGDGKCHKIFGKFLKNKKRNKIFISTKVGEIENKNVIKYRKFVPNFLILKKIFKYFMPHLSTTKKIRYRKDIIKKILPKYLKDLNTNYIDCIFLHNMNEIDQIKKFLKNLITEKKNGNIKYIGISLSLENNININILKKFDFIQLENSLNTKNYKLFTKKYPNIKKKIVFYGMNSNLDLKKNTNILHKFKNKTGLNNYKLLNLLYNIIIKKNSITLINSTKFQRINEILLLIKLIKRDKSLFKIINE